MINKVENALIAAITAVLVTAIVMISVNLLTIRPMRQQIERQNEVIIELAKIEKYRYTYEINNDFEKIKLKEGQVIIDLDNKLQGLQVNQSDSLSIDSTDVKREKSFWQKLQFWRKSQ